MPRHVDHEERRRALTDAVVRVVARSGIESASLQLVASEAGWSVGSLRHYFATKDDLLVGALERIADRIEARIVALPPRGGPLAQLRAVIDELLPLDDERREEALVWLAFIARAPLDARLSPVAEEVWRALHEPLQARLAEARAAGELPADLDVALEATRLHALIDGLVVHLVTAPRSATVAGVRAAADRHLAALVTRDRQAREMAPP